MGLVTSLQVVQVLLQPDSGARSIQDTSRIRSKGTPEGRACGLEIGFFEINDKGLKAAYQEGGCWDTKTLLNYYIDEGLTKIILGNTNKIPNEDLKKFNQEITELILR